MYEKTSWAAEVVERRPENRTSLEERRVLMLPIPRLQMGVARETPGKAQPEGTQHSQTV